MNNMNTYINDIDYSKYKDNPPIQTNLYYHSDKTPLYPGLYILGGMPSIGKTTFLNQLCDTLANDLIHTLYFSFREHPDAFIKKSISRIMYQNKCSEDEALEKYNKYNKLLYIEDYSNKDFYVPDIIDAVNFIEDYCTPVVIIDSLQDIAIADGETINDVIKRLKQFQMAHNLVVIITSSIKDGIYLEPISFNSFDESILNDVADVIWGLQLEIVNGVYFEKQGHNIEKQKVFNDNFKKSSRSMELVWIKNKFGDVYNDGTHYYPKENIFSLCPLLDLEDETIPICVDIPEF